MEDRAPASGPAAWVRDHAWAVALGAIVVLVGAAQRRWVLDSVLGQADFDEATVGVQAMRFTHGHLEAFFLNQPYGGTLEPGLVAVVFKVFGSSTFALKVVPMALALAAAWLTRMVAVELRLSRTAQWCAPILVWCGPAYAVLFSTKERGFYGVALVLSAAYLLLGLRLARDPCRRDVVLLGACVGLGWWQTPLTFAVAVPVVVWLLCIRPQVVRELLWAVPAALVAALPWLVWNAGHGWASLKPASGFGTSYGDRYFDWMLRLQVVTGLETPFDHTRTLVGFRWAGLVLLAVVLVLASIRTAWEAPGFLAAVILGYGGIYAINTLAAGVGADPRYMYLMVPVVAVSFAALLPEVQRDATRFAVGLAVLALVTTSTAWGLSGTRDAAEVRHPNAFLASPGIERVTRLLEAHGVEAAITDNSGMQLAFLSQGRVVGTSFAVPRLAAYEYQGRAAPKSTYVLDTTLLSNADTLRWWLTWKRIPFEEHTVGKYRVFFISKRVLPSDAHLVVFGGQLGASFDR